MEGSSEGKPWGGAGLVCVGILFKLGICQDFHHKFGQAFYWIGSLLSHHGNVSRYRRGKSDLELNRNFSDGILLLFILRGKGERAEGSNLLCMYVVVVAGVEIELLVRLSPAPKTPISSRLLDIGVISSRGENQRLQHVILAPAGWTTSSSTCWRFLVDIGSTIVLTYTSLTFNRTFTLLSQYLRRGNFSSKYTQFFLQGK